MTVHMWSSEIGVGVVCLSSGPWWLKCLIHDGQGPRGFRSKLLIPSHQHEMLIVRQSGSRRLQLVRSSQALICARASEGLDFLTIHLWFLSSLASESTLLGSHCVLYICEIHLCRRQSTLGARSKAPPKFLVSKTTNLIIRLRRSQRRLTDMTPQLKVGPCIWEADRHSQKHLIIALPEQTKR